MVGYNFKIALCVSVFLGCPLAARIQVQRATSDVNESSVRGDCGEPKMTGICTCGKWSKSSFAYQCSECLDKTKWGYGCVMDCPETCPDRCDFSGNCKPEVACPQNCKRNSRVDEPTKEALCVNTFGLCQACEDGWFGPMCESPCPTGCKDSKEGQCMRNGNCYKCQKGFYGPTCESKCPDMCPKCMMEAGKDDSGEDVPAGNCKEACRGDNFGGGCEEACPANCDRAGIAKGKASCSRNDGTCKKCVIGAFRAQCDSECSTGCIGKDCKQEDGVCVQGCVPGLWGETCDKACPKFTIMEKGCDRDDGFPKSCDATHYPQRSIDSTFCAACPANCLDSECDDKGHCTKGCATGFFGKTCSEECSPGCDESEGCAIDTGYCKTCKAGLTGMKCTKSCHSQCATCKQFVTGLLGASAATSAADCLTCPGDDPSEMSDDADAKCQCIAGAERPNSDSKCECKPPADPVWEAFFEMNPKKCSTRCKSSDVDGEELRPVSGRGTSKCIPLSFYNAIAAMWSKWYSGPMPVKGADGCEIDEYKIEDEGKSICLHTEFVEHIAGKDNVAKKGT